jgi:hypothetical protein
MRLGNVGQGHALPTVNSGALNWGRRFRLPTPSSFCFVDTFT